MLDEACTLCPRRCPSRRSGFCGAADFMHAAIAKTMLHHWEEPCISGERGTGAVFFAGCNLRCVFCQNHSISQAKPLPGARTDAARLTEIFWQLHAQGAETISLISPTHVLPVARAAMERAKTQGFPLRFVWNSNGYESAERIATLAALVDFYLPDLKYHSDELAQRYSAAPGYFACATAAIAQMQRQGEVLVRHLVLPGARKDAMRVLDWLAAQGLRVSLMAQYTPMHRAAACPPLHRRVTSFEYRSVLEHAGNLGLAGYMQGRDAATDAFTPLF